MVCGRRAKLIWSDGEISTSQNLPPENPKICLRQFFQCCDSCSVLPPSSFRRLRRLEFCPRIFTDGFAVWILPPTGSLFGASGAKKLQLYLLEPLAREFASGLKICLRRSSLHFSSVLHPCAEPHFKWYFGIIYYWYSFSHPYSTTRFKSWAGAYFAIKGKKGSICFLSRGVLRQP